jgi:predicted phage terminase large subunit-like protein
LNLTGILARPWLPQAQRTTLETLAGIDSPAELSIASREVMRTDLWLLLVLGLERRDLIHPWLFARCQEVQRSPNGHLDLWARAHYKSTIITFGLSIQDILASHGEDPRPEWQGHETTIGIFSHTRPAAKAFLRQIKLELERNEYLMDLFPDVLYRRPQRDSPRWSEDSGLVVRRRSNPKESTVEAWGLVDGQPTGKHFGTLLWDDVVVPASVTTPDMIQKTTESWELSLNLGTEKPRQRGIGTRYHFGDTYRTLIERGALRPRLHTATVDGSMTGEPVLLSKEALREKIRNMGPYTASAQLFLNPLADSSHRFDRSWLQHRFEPESVTWEPMQRALICDPSSGKKGSDYTAMAVLGKGPDLNVYLLDFFRDRLSLAQRGSEFIRLHRKWRPQLSAYEEYGMQADIDFIKSEQNRLTYRFEIEAVAGKLAKFDRVNRLVPLVAEGRFYMPTVIHRTSSEGRLEDQIHLLVEQEFLAWPVPAHDDGLDVISRMFDLESFVFPVADVPEHPDDRYNRPRRRGSWMAR